jgi:nickel/cobalt exporter
MIDREIWVLAGTAASWGASFVRLGKLERYSQALAGLMIFVSGLTVRFLGL